MTGIVVAVITAGWLCGTVHGQSEPARADWESAAEESARLYAKGDLEDAVRVLHRGLEREPDNAQLHFMLANALFRLRNWVESIHHYRLAANLRPWHPDTYLSLGHACYRAGQGNEAVEAWRTAVRHTPQDALPRLALAVGLAALGKLDEARGQMHTAVQLDPGWLERISIDVRWSREMVQEALRFMEPSH